MKTDDILLEIGWLTDDRKENKDNRQRLGYILRDMGIETKRAKEGRIIDLRDENNEKRLSKLYTRYKLWFS